MVDILGVTGSSDGRTPGTPTIGSATGGNATASVTFSAPSYLGKPAGTTYTVTSSPGGITGTGSSSPITVSIPTNSTAFPIGAQITVTQTGTGQITFAAVTPGTTTVNGSPGLKLRGQWSSAVLLKRDTEKWIVIGDTVA